MPDVSPAPLLTAGEALRLGTERLKRASFASAGLEMSLLLADALGTNRLGLYTNLDRPLDAAERDRARERLARRLRHEPIAYIIGHREFYGLQFEVTPAVLIPRPETELIVDQVLTFAESLAPPAAELAVAEATSDPVAEPTASAPATEAAEQTASIPAPLGPPLRCADVGTGSGAIAIAVAHALPTSTWIATDLSEPALAIARRNAEANDVAERIQFRHGDLLAPLAGSGPFDVICSNPPYIDRAEAAMLPADVRDFEPAQALFAPQQGLAILRALVLGAPPLLRPGGRLLLECGAGQAELLLQHARAIGAYSEAHAINDLSGIPRTLVLHRE